MSIESYNATRGPALLVQCMDIVRKRSATVERITLYSLMEPIASKHKVKGEVERRQLFKRISTAMRSLKSSGLVNMEREWDKERNSYINIITLCSEESVK